MSLSLLIAEIIICFMLQHSSMVLHISNKSHAIYYNSCDNNDFRMQKQCVPGCHGGAPEQTAWRQCHSPLQVWNYFYINNIFVFLIFQERPRYKKTKATVCISSAVFEVSNNNNILIFCYCSKTKRCKNQENVIFSDRRKVLLTKDPN